MFVNTPEEAGVTANTAGEQPASESGTARRTRANGEQSRQRILDAATEVATERGYEGTTISLVSKKSGLPPTSIYWHFADKDAVIAAVLERSHDRWFHDAAAYVQPPEGSDVREHLTAAVRHDIIALTKHPEFLRLGLMLSLERRPSEPSARALFHEKRRESHAQLEATFTRLLGGLTESREASQGVARQLATLVMAAADGLFIAYQVAPDEIDLDSLMELFVGGVLDRALSTLEGSDGS